MKKIGIMIGAASLVIVVCMIHLLREGISLGPAVLIKPSQYSSEQQIAESIARRLFPQLRQFPRWKIGGAPTPLTQLVTKRIQAEHPNVIFDSIDVAGSGEALRLEHAPVLYIETFQTGDFELSADCESMKRLDYRCFVETSLHKSRRRMKPDGKRHFLMTSYLERHFLVLVEY